LVNWEKGDNGGLGRIHKSPERIKGLVREGKVFLAKEEGAEKEREGWDSLQGKKGNLDRRETSSADLGASRSNNAEQNKENRRRCIASSGGNK